MERKKTQQREGVVNDAEKLKSTPKTRKRRPFVNRRWYTDEDKAAALAYLQSRGGRIRRAARELGIAPRTLHGWARGRGVGPNVAQHFRAIRDMLSAKLESVAHQVLDELPDKIDPASLVDLGATLGLMIDRMKLLREEPTVIRETVQRREMLERLIEQTLERFPGMSREEVIEIIRDVKPEAIKLLS